MLSIARVSKATSAGLLSTANPLALPKTSTWFAASAAIERVATETIRKKDFVFYVSTISLRKYLDIHQAAAVADLNLLLVDYD